MRLHNKAKKKDIAKKYGVGLTTLKRFLAKNNIIYTEPKGGKLNDLSVKEFIKSFKELGTFTSLGEKYNVSDKALQKWCERNNLPWRKSELVHYVKKLDEA